MTEKELTFAEHQSAAAAAGWKKLTKSERSAKARHAVKARWAKAKRKVTGDREQVTEKRKHGKRKRAID